VRGASPQEISIQKALASRLTVLCYNFRSFPILEAFGALDLIIGAIFV